MKDFRIQETTTIESVRNEARWAITEIMLEYFDAKNQNQLRRQHAERSQAVTIIIFALNSGLFTGDEASDWMDVVEEKQKIPRVSEKWMPPHDLEKPLSDVPAENQASECDRPSETVPEVQG